MTSLLIQNFRGDQTNSEQGGPKFRGGPKIEGGASDPRGCHAIYSIHHNLQYQTNRMKKSR